MGSAQTADGQFIADQVTDETYELYSVPLGGGSLIKLNDPLVTLGDEAAASISLDSSQVVFLADQEAIEVNELYSVPLGGGSPVKLNRPLPPGGDVFADFMISPDSARVV